MAKDGYENVLQAPLRVEDVCVRKAPGGGQVQYVEGSYVIAKLNEAFGILGWSFEILHQERLVDDEQVTSSEGKKTWRCYWSVHGRIRVDGAIVSEDVGTGDAAANLRGDAASTAMKVAATDALKRCARRLGWAAGLALYDGARDNLTAETTSDPKAPQKAVAKTKPQDGWLASWPSKLVSILAANPHAPRLWDTDQPPMGGPAAIHVAQTVDRWLVEVGRTPVPAQSEAQRAKCAAWLATPEGADWLRGKLADDVAATDASF